MIGDERPSLVVVFVLVSRQVSGNRSHFRIGWLTTRAREAPCGSTAISRENTRSTAILLATPSRTVLHAIAGVLCAMVEAIGLCTVVVTTTMTTTMTVSAGRSRGRSRRGGDDQSRGGDSGERETHIL